jgi:hypothetical protein
MIDDVVEKKSSIIGHCLGEEVQHCIVELPVEDMVA